MAEDLLVGFDSSEREKIKTHLERLLPYLSPDKFILVGGIPTRYEVISHGLEYPSHPFNDLDIIAQNDGVVSPDVVRDFLVYHYHPNSFLALVDPVSKTKVDIFNYDRKPLYTSDIEFEEFDLKIVSPEDQLFVTIDDILSASGTRNIDPKMIEDMRLLRQIIDQKKAKEVFEKRDKATVVGKVEEAEKLYKNHPDYFKEKPFRKAKPYVCDQCVAGSVFPLTPMEEVYKVLGFVE